MLFNNWYLEIAVFVMISDKFRYQLRKEAQKWQNEGLIEQELYQQLATRYHFENLDAISNNRFLAVIITLGFILLGLAIITFVAANWQVWSKSVKVFILLSSFIGINTTGFYLYREQSENWKSRLGQGLLLLGGLSLGANIGLMSQMFHQTGAPYKLFLFWGFGVLVMAYGLRLISLSILSIILVTIGYFSALGSSFNSYLSLEIQQMPLLVAILFIPLAYWCSSRWLFRLTLILFVVTFDSNLIRLLDLSQTFFPGLVAACASGLPPAFLWAYQDNLGFFANNLSLKFQSISRKFAVFYLGLLFYILSFNFWWGSSFKARDYSNLESVIEQNWTALIIPIIVLMVSVWWWWKLGRSQRNNHLWRIDRNSASIGIMILTTSLLVWWHYSIHTLAGLATFMFNLLLLLLAIGLIHQALKFGKRLGYWWGISLLSLQLFSRMLEYNTGLLFKAIVLFICGIGVILAGIGFENYLKQFNNSHRELSENG